ncbi:MAG: TaqI-like C-terminal specificity domain-containing protein [Planctomycetota bacterium]
MSRSARLARHSGRAAHPRRIPASTAPHSYPQHAERWAELLSSTYRWRQTLAADMTLAAYESAEPDVHTVASRVIEGVIFLRAGQQRGLEPAGRIPALLAGGEVAARLADLLRSLDERYCGGRSHFRAPVEQLSKDVLIPILRELETLTSAEEGIPAGVLGRVYEQSVSMSGSGRPAVRPSHSSRRRMEGIYYTPSRLVEHILDLTLAPRLQEVAGDVRVLDPSCGGGAFLLAAGERLFASSAQDQVYDERARITSQCLFGVDQDSRAVETTRLALMLKLSEGCVGADAARVPDLTGNIRCADALSSLDWRTAFPAVFVGDNSGFDVVVGNPPWGQKRIRKDRRMMEFLRQRFPSSTGVFDLFRPFVELAVRLCRPGGRIGQVLPDIVLLKNYEPTRRYLLDNLTLLALDWWGMAFPGATIDTTTIVGIRQPAPDGHQVRVTVHDPDTPLRHSLPQMDFRRNERCTFNLHLTTARRGVLEHLKRSPRLGDAFEVHEGVHSGNMRAELFVDRRLDETCHKLIVGRDELAPYSLQWRGRYVRLGVLPAQRTRQRYANPGRPEWHAADKVLVRRTGDRVQAAVDRAGYHASNNFFVVLPRGSSMLDLDGLCALLNSPLITWFFRTIEPRKGRVFAELKIKHLVSFPLPDPRRSPADIQHLNEFGCQRRRLVVELGHMEQNTDTEMRRKCLELDKRIEGVVQRIFALSALSSESLVDYTVDSAPPVNTLLSVE